MTDLSVAIDKRNGAVVQRFDVAGPSCASNENGSVFVCGDKAFKKDGKALWSFAGVTTAGTTQVMSKPMSAQIVKQTLFTICDDGNSCYILLVCAVASHARLFQMCWECLTFHPRSSRKRKAATRMFSGFRQVLLQQWR